MDEVTMKRAIGHFQKSSKLEKTRRLDRTTMDRLHRVTAKSASGEGWIVSKAVKSTVAELSGKGGEMVMGIVLITLAVVGIMYGLTFVSYLSESKVLDELVSKN